MNTNAILTGTPPRDGVVGRNRAFTFLSSVAGWLPLVILPSVPLWLRAALVPWEFMWVLAFAVFAGCKWLTWWRCAVSPRAQWRNWAYLFAWPGLDAAGFLDDTACVAQPQAWSWCMAWLKMWFGGALLVAVAWEIPYKYPLVIGWCGLLGLVFLLHFGLFHLLALTWQKAGVNARPLMANPIGATSLGEFWGRRWNSAFNQLAHDLLFRPLRRKLGVATSTLLVFVVSGLVHELVISVPARGGYGGPTLYFTLQGVGVLLERSGLGKAIGLRRGLAGWCFTLLFTAGPAFWLFHPQFIARVILPFLQAIHAI